MTARNRADAADGTQYRVVIEHLDEDGNVALTRFIGPFATAAPAKGRLTSSTRGYERRRGRVEFSIPTWIPLTPEEQP